MLVLIRNFGCDDSTTGLAEFTTEIELNNFIETIINLNKNSYYNCMPTIELYEFDKNDIIKLSTIRAVDVTIDVDKRDIVYLKGEPYTFAFPEWGIIEDYQMEEKELIKRYLSNNNHIYLEEKLSHSPYPTEKEDFENGER